MRGIERVFLDFRAHIGRNILLITMFSALLSVFLIILSCWISANREISFLQENLGNSVFISRPSVATPYYYGGFSENEINQLKENSYVQAYNAYSWYDMYLIDGDPYIVDQQAYEKYKKKVDEALAQYGIVGVNLNCKAFSITDSEKSNLFAGGGFKLISGEPILPSDNGREVALVSDYIAEINGWKIGDNFSLRACDDDIARGFSDEILTFTIKGIFSYKDARISPLNPYEYPPNFIFIPNGILEEKYRHTTRFLYAYIESTDKIESFVSEIKQTWGLEGPDTENQLCTYEYRWDEGWMESVSFPLRQLNDISKIIAIVVLLCLLSVAALVTALIIRRKRYEFAIFLSMGESKAVLVFQTVCEMLIIFILSIMVGIFTAGILREPVSQKIMEPYTQLNNTILEQQKDEEQFERDMHPVLELIIRENSVFFRETQTNVPSHITSSEMLSVALILLIVISSIIAVQCVICLRVPCVEPKRFR